MQNSKKLKMILRNNIQRDKITLNYNSCSSSIADEKTTEKLKWPYEADMELLLTNVEIVPVPYKV